MPFQQVYLSCPYDLRSYDIKLCPQCKHRYSCDVVYKHTMQQIKDKAIAELAAMDDGTCKGCKQQGAWDNEIELGYNCPCMGCKRNFPDCYEPKGVAYANGTQ